MKFLKEWGVFLIILILAVVHIGTILAAPNTPMNSGLSKIQLWNTVNVDGNSMDPNLANGQKLIISKIGQVNRFDIVVAKETTAQTRKNDPTAASGKVIIKRVIGMPGDTIAYHKDSLTINGKKYDEPYLSKYQELFNHNKLADSYSSLPLNSSLTESQRSFFVSLAETSRAFTVDNTGNPDFMVRVPKGEYLLLGDDRIVSADSRKVGSFTRSQILGKAVFRIWPFNKIGGLK